MENYKFGKRKKSKLTAFHCRFGTINTPSHRTERINCFPTFLYCSKNVNRDFDEKNPISNLWRRRNLSLKKIEVGSKRKNSLSIFGKFEIQHEQRSGHFSIKNSLEGIFSVEDLMEDFKPVVTENNEFEYRENAKF